MNAHLEKLEAAKIANAKDLILICEENFPNDGACAPGDPSDALSRRHLERSCAGYLDGHVEMVSRSGGNRKDRVWPTVRN
jgi:hypothetical protein